MSDEKAAAIVEEEEEEETPATNMAYYLEKFVNCINAYESEASDEKKADAIRWAYSSLLYIEDEAKETRKDMRQRFKIRDAEVKQWLEKQEKLEAEEMEKSNVLPAVAETSAVDPSTASRADNTGVDQEAPDQ